ncbi:MAG: FKBP-type peptidyl-prolyl cis-trans isomerase [Verrucomicrobiota bacterium]|nr:FKBP-type peptidyl-prolyl cis-trans isomerase [Verrucomicrobiota bacterium]
MPKYTLIIIVALGGAFYFARTIFLETAIEAKEQITESVEEVELVESVDEVVASEVVEVAGVNEEAVVSAPTEAQMIEAFAYFSTFQSGYQAFGFSAKDATAITSGVALALSDTEPSDAMIALIQSPEFQAFMQPRTEAAQAEAAAAQAEQQAAAEAAGAEAAQENIAAGKVFISNMQGDEDLQSTDSGLYYKIVEPGEGDRPSLTDSVLVHYKGTRIDGTTFDSSYERGEPATFPLNGVVAGFGEGLTKIAAGGKIILYIPSDLGYGNTPRPGGEIQPGDTLVFECELIEINPGS